jgi:hypothetical protein
MRSPRPARTDAHAPKVLITEDYDLAAYFDFQEPRPEVVGPNANGQYFTIPVPRAILEERARIRRLLANPEHRQDGQCDHCGARIRYTAILKHTPTGGYISVGEQCMDNRFSQSSSEFQAMRKAAELDRGKQRIKKAVAEFVAANPDLYWMAAQQTTWEMAGMTADGGHLPDRKPNYFVIDVAHKLRTYGSLSEKQADAVRASLVRDAEFAAQRAVRAAEKAAAEAAREPRQSVPTGRQTVAGVVVALKEVEDRFAPVSRYSRSYPTTWKMVVEDDRGFRVFGSVPRGLLAGAEIEHGVWRSRTAESLKGCRVSFTAELEPSQARTYQDNYSGEDVSREADPLFGFFRRPTSPKMLAEAPADAAVGK